MQQTFLQIAEIQASVLERGIYYSLRTQRGTKKST